jgi:hypothetical protein
MSSLEDHRAGLPSKQAKSRILSDIHYAAVAYAVVPNVLERSWVAACRPPRAEKRNRAARCARPSPPTPCRAKRARRSLTSAATRLPSLDATFP